jgi:hypothetical protein
MQGILAMLSGKGEAKNRARHKAFRDAIPQNFPSDMTISERAVHHPAYSGPMSNSLQAADYRRAHYGGGGPQSQAEHRAFDRRQTLQEDYEREVVREGKGVKTISFKQWLQENGIPLPE